MITAIDANIILDIITGSPKEIHAAQSALLAARKAGEIVISVVAFAEVAAQFPTRARADDFFALISCRVDPLEKDAAFLSGQFFDEYTKRGGKRSRILADFLIAAHAQLNADRILTRDGRFFGSAFPRLKAVSPADLV